MPTATMVLGQVTEVVTVQWSMQTWFALGGGVISFALMLARIMHNTAMLRQEYAASHAVLASNQNMLQAELKELKGISSDLLRITAGHGTELAVQRNSIDAIQQRLRTLERKHDVQAT